MSQINIIAAISQNKVLGKNNGLIWKNIPGDMKHFKEITNNHAIIMGRKTFESIGSKPLPNRTNIIVTRNTSLKITGVFVFPSLDKAVEFAKEKDNQIFVIGGGEIYSQSIMQANRLFLTIVEANVDGDTFFPEYSEFTKTVSEQIFPKTKDFPYQYKFITLER
jgi:dihydrofolate reductase